MTVARVRPGMKEQDLAAELEYAMRQFGAEKPSFETIVAGGARGSLPHAQPTAAPLNTGSLVVVVNAVIDALSDYGIKNLNMPLTPEKIWRAIEDAKAKAA